MKKEAGFTLVEIAIVLVVIGLLLGAILAGQEVVLNGQIRNVINEYNNVASAVYVYQDRYRQIPGDDMTASARWLSNNAISPPAGTGGNRLIDGTWDTGTSAEETGLFWHHLRNDELVAGPRSGATPQSFQLPRNAFNGVIGVQEGAFAGGIPDTVICQSEVPAKAAIVIDSRLDDDTGDGEGSDSGNLQGGADETAADGQYDLPNEDVYLLCRELG
ncbi:MAG TPA: prepilin-type N-terminal cleavage/methylation domain-containing protein [Gammaproteobacteria bacterium]|nr:prepilin-type N-terminal cleavage/methylation domain-containing protein [Gammaproteobacteria bacterium]